MPRGTVSTLIVCVLIVLAGCVGSGDIVAGPTTTPANSPTDSTTEPTASATASAQSDVTVEVVDVVDGDTIKVVMPDGSRETVRLLGVDTPEVYGSNTPDEFEGVPDTETGRTCLRAAGHDASDFATDRLANRTVELRFDEKAGERGYYGRLLAYVVVDGSEFNYELLTNGHARFYESSFEERARYETAELEAREQGVGLWSCATEGGSTSGTGTSTDEGISVSVVADAAGNDNENLNGEYVRLQNDDDTDLDISGWSVVDAAGATYTFAEGTSLEAGGTLTLYTGSGTNTATEVYWGRSGAVWNNDGDTLTLTTSDGETVLTYSYD